MCVLGERYSDPHTVGINMVTEAVNLTFFNLSLNTHGKPRFSSEYS